MMIENNHLSLEDIKALCEVHEDSKAIFSVFTMKALVEKLESAELKLKWFREILEMRAEAEIDIIETCRKLKLVVKSGN